MNTGTLVIQAFNATTGEVLYKKSSRCVNIEHNSEVPELVKTELQRIYEINATHAFTLCTKLQNSVSGSGSEMITIFDSETGETASTITAVFPNGKKVMENTNIAPSLDVTVSAPEDGLFAMTDAHTSYVLNLHNHSLVAHHEFEGIYRAYDHNAKLLIGTKSNGWVGSLKDHLYARRMPSAAVTWHHNYTSVDTKVITVGHTTVNINLPKRATIVPVLFADNNRTAENNYDCSKFRISLLDVETGSTLRTISLTDPKKFFFLQDVTIMHHHFEFQGPYTNSAGGGRHVMILLVKSIGSNQNQTCGVIAFDVNDGDVVWMGGFEYPFSASGLYFGRFSCKWHSDPSTPQVGWLVSQELQNPTAPVVSIHDIQTGSVLATASSAEPKPVESAEHLQLPFHSLPNGNKRSFKVKKVASSLFKDILLLKYPVDQSGMMMLIGIRLDSSSLATNHLRFAGNFKIHPSEDPCVDISMLLQNSTFTDKFYSIKTRLVKRLNNEDMLLVPVFDRMQGNSRLQFVNISALYQPLPKITCDAPSSNNSSNNGGAAPAPKDKKSHVTGDILIGLGCILVVVVATVGILVLRKRRTAQEGSYDSYNGDDDGVGLSSQGSSKYKSFTGNEKV